MIKLVLISAFIMLIHLGAQAQKNTHVYDAAEQVADDENALINAAESSPEDLEANYKLAFYYYNRGVSIIENMDYSKPQDVLFAQQQSVMQLFKKALPYALKATEINPSKSEIFKILSGIYFGLNDIEASEKYDALAKASAE